MTTIFGDLKHKKAESEVWIEGEQQDEKDAETDRRRAGTAQRSCVSFLSKRKRGGERKERQRDGEL